MPISPSAHFRGSSIRPLRSRLGCKTCKARRVKCGEEKPNCLRCSSTGRKCEYESTISHTFSSSTSVASILENPLSLSSNTVWRERRAFAYYFKYAATFIGGDLDIDFWCTIVPQVCRSEPAVWDATISISSLFESPDPCPDPFSLQYDHSYALNQNQQDALGWYSRSVSTVRQGIERGNIDTFAGIITCLLFVCIEALLGDVGEALRLYKQGVHLIRTLQTQNACRNMTATKISLLKGTIIPIFIQLGAFTLHSGTLAGNLLQETQYASTEEIISLKSAREAIIILAVEIQLFELTCEEYLQRTHACYISQELMILRKGFSSRLQSWYTAFTNLMKSRYNDILSPLQSSANALLLTYYEMLSVILAVCVSSSRATTDAHIQNFEEIVEQSSIALSGSARCDGTRPPFTFEISVDLPLWFTCVRCREPTTRRRALALLRQAHQGEGRYKRDHMGTLGETIMMLEEMHGMTMTAGQRRAPGTEVIPGEARIRPLGIFRPRDGCPSGMTEEDIAILSQKPDQPFLQFSRNEFDPSNNAWRTIYGYASIDL